ncbi:hypothetical protein [Helicobacter sp. 11S02596-1]|uniref:hypothetical protein n=1 Tax=Helicobacter sp. 11S02596-1 TaxID=1476194 RepID=UPI00117A5862|nr:hypothetical protein [Helicobacter sp. 11S02596-1]
MSRKEKIKLTIDLFKAIILALLTGLFGIFGYAVIHYKSIDTIQLIAIILGVGIIVLAFYLIVRYIIRQLDELEKIE